MEKTKLSAIVVDMDGTLTILEWQLWPPYPLAWNEKPNPEIIEELEKEWYPLWVEIIVLTGRKYSEYYNETVSWLDKNIEYDQLIMNMSSHPLPNHLFKKETLRVLMQVYDIRMVYDDNPEVGKVCNKLRLPFKQVY